MNKVKTVYAIYDHDEGSTLFFKTRVDAQKGLKSPDYDKGLVGDACGNLKDYVGLNIPRKKVVKITFSGF